MEYDVLDIAC